MMRYWIYWNDLVQGPFELDELSTLKALSEDLPVCLEDRTDWLPACRIADLAPIIEERRSARMPPPPPPPPPTGRPAADPLQGEFFTEAPNQKWLFPDNDPSKGPFAWSQNQLEMKTVFPEVSFTTPIHFYGGGSAVATAPHVARPVEKVAMRNAVLPIISETFPSRTSPVPALDEQPMEDPSASRISLEIYPDIPEPVQESPAPLPFQAIAAESPSELPALSMEEPARDKSTLRLAGWITSIFATLLLIGTLSYKWFDSSTSRAAIREAKKHVPLAKPIALPPEKIFCSTLVPPLVIQPLPKAAIQKDIIPIKRPKKRKAVAAPAAAVPVAAPVVEAPKAPEAPKKEVASDPWKERQKEAIALVMAKNLPRLHQTVAERAQSLVDAHPAQKISWDALQVAGPLYRVSLLVAETPVGGGLASLRLYPFVADLKHQRVTSDDEGTSTDFLKAKKKITPAPVVPPVAPAVIPPVVSAATPEPSSSAAVPNAVPPATPAANEKPDRWKDRYNDAITLTTNKKLSTTGQTIGERARIMLEGMHDKELLYAADTGQRLYLPDKIAWSALREKGPLYRVYLGFSADQANGERIQSQAYQFQANLEQHTILTDDAAAAADFLEVKTPLVHKREQRAADIQNILSAVDLLNKHLMRAIIVKDSRKNRLEEKNISAAIKSAMQRFQRAVIYFRTQYPDTMLQNIAQAYAFTKLLKDHV